MPGRVLVTGITGFAGRYLARRLRDAGYEVAGLAAVEHDLGELADLASDLHRVNLLDTARLTEIVVSVAPTHVVHLAAISFVGHQNVAELYGTNIVGTRNLLQALTGLSNRPRNVLLTSSANIYGNSDRAVLDEDAPPAPANDYAVSKIAMEYMAAQFRDRLPITICRPFNYTGIGQSETFLIPKIVNHFRRREKRIALGNIEISRDFSDVRTVVDYMARLMESPAARGHVYNICSGRAHSLRYVLDTCARLTGHNISIVVNPDLIRANEVTTLRGDPARLHEAVGRAEEHEFDDTLSWMLRAPG